MASGETYKISLEFSDSVTSKSYFPGFYVKQTTLTGFDVSDVGALVKEWWDVGRLDPDPQKQWHAANIALESVRLRKIDPLEPLETAYTSGLPIAGSATGASYSASSAILFSLRTDFIGRSYRGRLFLPTPSESNCQNGILADADALDMADEFVALIGDLATTGAGSAADAQVSVWSPKLAIATEVTHVKVDTRLRSQRRRQLRAPAYQTA